jgi:hypothetical protein
MERNERERLAAIEEIVIRVEDKLDTHIASITGRVSWLEKAWAWASGAASLLLAGSLAALGAYFKAHR